MRMVSEKTKREVEVKAFPYSLLCVSAYLLSLLLQSDAGLLNKVFAVAAFVIATILTMKACSLLIQQKKESA